MDYRKGVSYVTSLAVGLSFAYLVYIDFCALRNEFHRVPYSAPIPYKAVTTRPAAMITNTTGSTGSMTRHCKPVQRIVYLKVHKTGSGTTASILDRYGFKHNLTFAVPNKTAIIGRPLSNYTYKFDSMIRCYGQFDMLTNHMVYNKEEVDKFIPNAVYIGSLREPVSHFESLFYQVKVAKELEIPAGVKDPIKAFFKIFTNYDVDNFRPNYQLHYLDISDREIKKGNFARVFKKLDSDIHLFIIMEYYLESLVLLKNLLCWDLDDVVYVPQHVRINSSKQISKYTRSKIEQYNSADMKLYNYYNRTLWSRIEATDQDVFWRDVRELRKRVAAMQETCVSNTRVYRGKWIENIAPADKHYCDNYVRLVGPDGNIKLKKERIDKLVKKCKR
ncbi:galactosylceramide sulfotransferase-like [Amphiura filiformis]|uniref:galactosylceramide sulfotransferase-like n=1 Tax=Amphiura filiformis TaxID=82378 RepID=UPI003B219CA6